jgi:hypothetical protein
VADELLDPRRHAKELADDRRQAVGVAHVAHQRAGVKQPGEVRNGIPLPQRLRGDAHERSDVDLKPIVLRPIAVDVRLRLRPGAVEERDEPVMEQIEEPAQRGIAGVPQAMSGVLGDVDGHRPVGAEQAEQPDLQARRRPILAEFERRQRGRGERHVGILSKPQGLVNWTEGRTPAWLVAVQALESPQRLVEVVAIRLPRQIRQEVQSVGLVPQFGAHRLISPRLCDRNTVSVTELIDT